MTISRYAAAVLVLPLLAAVPPASSAPAAAPSRTVDAKFGDLIDVPAVSSDVGAVKIRFQGRKGQGLVLTDTVGDADPGCEDVTLTSGGRTVRRGEMGTWMFPRTGSYVVDYRHSCGASSSGGADQLQDITLELQRIVVHDGRVGRRLDTRISRTTAHAYRVPVPAGPGIRVAGRFPGDTLVEAARMLTRPGRASERRNLSTMCRPGSLITSAERLGDACGYPVRRRDDYVVLAGKPTTLEPYAATTATLDKAGPSWRGAAPRLLRFSGKAGTFVTLDVANLDLTSARDEDSRLRLVGAEGIVDPDANGEDAFGHRFPERTFQELMWELPTTGTYAFELAGNVVDPGSKVTATVRTVSVVPLEIGVPTTLTVGPGWSFAQLPEVTSTYVGQITVLSTSPGLAPGWRVFGPNTGDESGPVTTVGTGVPFDTPTGIVAMPGRAGASGTITVRLDRVS